MAKKGKSVASAPATPAVKKPPSTALGNAWDKEAPSTAKNIRHRGIPWFGRCTSHSGQPEGVQCVSTGSEGCT
eukprot:6486631-Amphidinium_carterae.1